MGITAGTIRRSGGRPRGLAAHEFLVAAVLMAALVVAFFSPVFRFGGSLSYVRGFQTFTYPWVPHGQVGVFMQHDQPDYVYPRQVFLDRSIKEDHELPLWDPLTFGGHPFFAETGSRLAYPPLLLLTALFKPSTTHDSYLMLHVFLAGFLAFAMMKQFKVRFGPAFLTGVAWAFCSYGLLYYVLEMYAAVAALLPLAVLLVRRWHDERSWSSLLLAGLVLGLLYLGTSAELALMSFLFVGGYAASLALRTVVSTWSALRARERAGVGMAPLALGACALAVAAVQIVPFLSLSATADRAHIPYSDLLKAYPGSRLVDFLYVFRAPHAPLSGANPLSQQVFAGTAVGVLALVGLCTRRPGAAMARGLVVFLVLFNLGTPLTRVLYHLPGIESLHGFSRSLFLMDFGIAVLGGLGLDALMDAASRARERRRGGWLGPLGVNPSLRAAIAIAVVAALVLATYSQLFRYGRGVNPPFERRDMAGLLPSTPAIEVSRALVGDSPGRGRVLPIIRPHVPLGLSHVLPGNTNMAEDLRTPIGYEPIVPESSALVFRAIWGEPIESITTVRIGDSAVNARISSDAVRVDLLPRAGVAAVLAPPGMAQDAGWDAIGAARRGLRLAYSGEDGTVYQVVNALPRAMVVGGEAWVASADAALARFMDPGFDPTRQVLLQGAAPSGLGAAAPREQAVPDARVDWQVDRPNTLRIAVTSPRPGWLVVRDSWDPGWKAEVDGRRTRVVRADLGFRAVRVPAGTSVVGFVYDPTAVFVGASISVAAELTLGLVAIVPWIRRRTAGRRGRRTPRTRRGGPPAPLPPPARRTW